MNAAHHAMDDDSDSLITWTTDINKHTDYWFHILPNVTRDGVREIVIKIKHGFTIKIDAKQMMHCSTMKSNNEYCNIYGTFFGCKDR